LIVPDHIATLLPGRLKGLNRTPLLPVWIIEFCPNPGIQTGNSALLQRHLTKKLAWRDGYPTCGVQGVQLQWLGSPDHSQTGSL